MIRHLFSLAYWAKNYHSVFLGAWITLLLPTILVGVTDGLNPGFWTAAVLLLLSFVLWLTSTERILNKITRLRLKGQFRAPKLAILSIKGLTNAQLQNKNLLRWTKIAPSEWEEKLGPGQLTIDEISDNWSMIINPFGELYPEKNIPNMETLNKIKKYIRRGGVFVNISGLAFAYMWNPDTGVEENTGRRLMAYKVVQKAQETLLIPVVVSSSFDLLDTCLFRNFGVRTTLFDAEKAPLAITVAPGFEDIFDDLNTTSKSLPEFRSALHCENPQHKLVPILKATYEIGDGRSHECYPAAGVRYGGGYLILFGIVLETQETLSIVIRTVEYLISKLQREGTLESS